MFSHTDEKRRWYRKFFREYLSVPSTNLDSKQGWYLVSHTGLIACAKRVDFYVRRYAYIAQKYAQISLALLNNTLQSSETFFSKNAWFLASFRILEKKVWQLVPPEICEPDCISSFHRMHVIIKQICDSKIAFIGYFISLFPFSSLLKMVLYNYNFLIKILLKSPRLPNQMKL